MRCGTREGGNNKLDEHPQRHLTAYPTQDQELIDSDRLFSLTIMSAISCGKSFDAFVVLRKSSFSATFARSPGSCKADLPTTTTMPQGSRNQMTDALLGLIIASNDAEPVPIDSVHELARSLCTFLAWREHRNLDNGPMIVEISLPALKHFLAVYDSRGP